METLKKRTLCLLAVALLLTACKAESSAFSTLTRQLGIQIPNGEILAEQDSHGGFHGDGETFIKIKFSEEEAESLTSEMKSSPGWHMLPLTENLSTILYGYESDVFSCYNIIRRYSAPKTCILAEFLYRRIWRFILRETQFS